MDEIEDALERTKLIYQPEYRENVHCVWEKTIGNQKLVVVAFYNPYIKSDLVTPFIFVYENSKLKHFHFQDGMPRAMTYIDNFKDIKPPCDTIEKRSEEAQFYFHIVRAFRDASTLFSCPSDKGDVRWATFPKPKTPEKYLGPSVFDNLAWAMRYARKLKSKEFAGLADEFYKRLGKYIFTKYKFFEEKQTEETKEVQALLHAVAVKHGLFQIIRGKTTQEEAERRADAVLAGAALDILVKIVPEEKVRNEIL